MAMDVGGNRKGVRADINVTPLIDVVLVLLIIFMVLVPSMLKELTANIPRKDESNTPPDPSASPVVVEYTAKGELSLNGEPVAPEVLADKVAEKIKYKSQKVVFFKIEDNAPYGDAIRFMDIVWGAGATTLGIVTQD
jgi:biopolymer transport protein TolR